MAKDTVLELSPELAKEMPMVDLVYELLNKSPEPIYFRDLTAQIAEIKGLTSEEMLDYMAQLYTEINIDGRFICVGRSLWGIKERYTMEQSTDAGVAANLKEDDEMEDDYFEEKEDDDFDSEASKDEEDEVDPIDSDEEEFDGNDLAEESDEDDF